MNDQQTLIEGTALSQAKLTNAFTQYLTTMLHIL